MVVDTLLTDDNTELHFEQQVVLEEVERRCTKGPVIVVTVFLGLCLGSQESCAFSLQQARYSMSLFYEDIKACLSILIVGNLSQWI